MLSNKTRPKLKFFLDLGISFFLDKKNEKNVKKNKSLKFFKFFSPQFCFSLRKKPIRLKKIFASLLKEKNKIKLRYGFHKTASLRKFLTKNFKKRITSNRFLKELELVSLLEQRIDLILFRLGYVSSLFEAKQLISHKKINVNNKIISRFSCFLKKGDIVSLSPSIEQSVRNKIQEQSKKRIFYFTEFSNLEINWKTLKFVVLTEKLNLSKQLPHFSFILNWKIFSEE